MKRQESGSLTPCGRICSLYKESGRGAVQQPLGDGAANVLVDLAKAPIITKSWRKYCMMMLSIREAGGCVAETLQAVKAMLHGSRVVCVMRRAQGITAVKFICLRG